MLLISIVIIQILTTFFFMLVITSNVYLYYLKKIISLFVQKNNLQKLVFEQLLGHWESDRGILKITEDLGVYTSITSEAILSFTGDVIMLDERSFVLKNEKFQKEFYIKKFPYKLFNRVICLINQNEFVKVDPFLQLSSVDKKNYTGLWQSEGITIFLNENGTASFSMHRDNDGLKTGTLKISGKEIFIGDENFLKVFQIMKQPYFIENNWYIEIDNQVLNKIVSLP